MKKNIAIVFLTLLFLLQLSFNVYLWRDTDVPKIHVLEKPLKITSTGENYSEYTLLPEGTVLYDDSDSLNRRVKVYFNLLGVDFKFEEQDPNILKQPSEVRVIMSSELQDILKTIPLTKKDIYLIIKFDKTINDSERSVFFKKYKINPLDFEND